MNERYGLTTHMKSVFSSLYPSIILENNIAPNTQIGKIIIEDPNNPERSFSSNEHRDMYSNDDEPAKYQRGGEFLENMMSDNPLEFGKRWFKLGDIHEVIEDMKEFFSHNAYRGYSMEKDPNELMSFLDAKEQDLFIECNYSSMSPLIRFHDTLNEEYKENLIDKIKKDAML